MIWAEPRASMTCATAPMEGTKKYLKSLISSASRRTTNERIDATNKSDVSPTFKKNSCSIAPFFYLCGSRHNGSTQPYTPIGWHPRKAKTFPRHRVSRFVKRRGGSTQSDLTYPCSRGTPTWLTCTGAPQPPRRGPVAAHTAESHSRPLRYTLLHQGCCSLPPPFPQSPDHSPAYASVSASDPGQSPISPS